MKNNEKVYYNLIGDRSIIYDIGKDNFTHVLIFLNHYNSYINKMIYSMPLTDVKNINIYVYFDLEISIMNSKIYEIQYKLYFQQIKKRSIFKWSKIFSIRHKRFNRNK